MVVFRFVDLGALALALGLYVFFTVFFWGTFYYHLRTGAPKTNFVRFWRLVLENPDSTSGNFLEQVPKALHRRCSMLEYLVVRADHRRLALASSWRSRRWWGSRATSSTGGSSTGSRSIQRSRRGT